MMRVTNVLSTSSTILRWFLLGTLVASAPLLAQESEHAHHTMPAKLVQEVRAATAKYIDVNNAAPDYGPAFGCVSGPDHGAMGIHYINGTFAGDGLIEVDKPEALIYEPVGNERRLVGVEYIVDAKQWLSNPDNHNLPPALEGQSFNLVGEPNRFNIPAFFELHVWAWRDNPQGAFVDWNNKVTCEKQ